MKIKLFWKLAIILVFVSFPYLAESTTILRLPGGFTISNMVKHSHLVFTGEVIDLEFVFRANIPPQFTTDVTMKVEEMIKGKPNAGKNLVKFMLPGGKGVHPETGEHLIAKRMGTPKFKRGEKVLLFLAKGLPPRFNEMPRPYERLHPLKRSFGKRVIKDGEVYIPYTIRDMVEIEIGNMKEMDVERGIQLPIDLVVQIAKASLKDAKKDAEKDALATELLEERIKEFIELTPRGVRLKPDKEFIDSLREEVRKILTKE